VRGVLVAVLLGSIGLSASRAAAQDDRAPRTTVRVSGFAHVDWTVYRQSSRDALGPDRQPLNDERFLIRRARIRAEGDQGLFHGVFEVDGNTVAGPQVRPFLAEATLKWPAARPYARTPWAHDPSGGATTRISGAPWFMVTAGLFRTPFGFEVPEAERDRPLLERTTVSNALFPQSIDLGLRVLGGFRFLRWTLGIMNGDPLGERTFPGRDPNRSKDLVFRIGAAGEVLPGVVLSGGVSGLTGRGFHEGRAATTDGVTWRDANDNGVIDGIAELEPVPGVAAGAPSSFKRRALGADLRASITIPTLGELHLRGEVTRAANLDRGLLASDPVAAGRDQDQIGWYAGASQELTRWALVAVRYDRYDPDDGAPRDLTSSNLAFAAVGRFGPGRLSGQLDHRPHVLGRDASGQLTTIADDTFTVRFEARF
jgi:hypothetical protein